jgi:hypothetical protein
MKQTAVEWYAEQAMRLELEKAKGNISINQMLNQLSNVLEQAKEMEKDQIIKACNDTIKSVELDSDKTGFIAQTGEGYYNKTYNK